MEPTVIKCLAIGALISGAIFSLSSAAEETPAESRFVPATFKPGEDSLESRFFVPKSREDKELTIFCNALISVRGVIEEQQCNWDHKNKPYRIPAENSIRNVRLNPASVDGEKVIAYIKYALKIEHKGGESSIKMYPHHFVNSQYYGDDYIAPQSYVPGTDLYADESIFFGKPWIEREVARKCIRSARVFLKMKIENDGGVSDVAVIDKPSPKSCGDSIAEAAKKGTYIPAFFQGKPVASIYVEKYLAERNTRRIGQLAPPDNDRLSASNQLNWF